MDTAAMMENLYHEIMMGECKSIQAQEWEQSRHTIMEESIHDTILYYSKCYEQQEENSIGLER